jgi:aminoglycoside phosphotransferase (APT) family kinase protein
MPRLHDDELEVDEVLVRRLLATLSPAYAGLPLRRLASTGSTNTLFRLGDDLVVRVPRQPGGTSTIEKEQRWLPYVARSLAVAVPEVVAVGEPAAGYPERWSIVRYVDGEPPRLPSAGEAPRHDLAHDLAGVVTALRRATVPAEAVGDPSLRWYRGEPLSRYDDDLHGWLEQCRSAEGLDLDLDSVERAWDAAVALPDAHEAAEPRWYHGDLLAENLLVRDDGRLSAVLDFGGLAVGDPAVDLVVAWELLDPVARTTFRNAVGVTDGEWSVARGWALALGVMVFPYYWQSMPARCAQRLFMARQVLAEAAVSDR